MLHLADDIANDDLSPDHDDNDDLRSAGGVFAGSMLSLPLWFVAIEFTLALIRALP